MLGGAVDGDGEIESGNGLGAAVLNDDLHLFAGGVVGVAGDGGVDTGWVVAGEGPAEVEHAVAIVGVGAGGAGFAGVGLQDLPGERGCKGRVLRQDGGDGAGHDGGTTRGATKGDAGAVGPGGLEAEAGCGDLELTAGVGEDDLLVIGVDGSDGDDAGIGGGPGELRGLVVAGGSDEDGTVGRGVVDGGVEGGVGAIAAEADVDDFRAGIGGGEDGLGNGEGVALVVVVGDADAENIRAGGDALGVECLAGGEGGDGGAVSTFLAGAGGGAEADVEGGKAAEAEGGVGGNAAVEDGDGGAETKGLVVAGDAELGEQIVADGLLVSVGAGLGLWRCRRVVDEKVGGDLAVIGGVVQEFAGEVVEFVVLNADCIGGIDTADDAKADLKGSGEEIAIGLGGLEGQHGFVRAGGGAFELMFEFGGEGGEKFALGGFGWKVEVDQAIHVCWRKFAEVSKWFGMGAGRRVAGLAAPEGKEGDRAQGEQRDEEGGLHDGAGF